MRFKLLAGFMMLALTGCQTMHGVRQTHKPAPPRAPVVNPLPGIEAGKTAAPIPAETPAAIPAPPDTSMLATYPKTAESISGPAVLSLLKKASEARAAGQPGQATSTLERAVRIEPRNYFVWSALATTYLQSKVYEQAESVAKKSNSLARGNVYVEQENWRVIHAVRIALGDAEGAAQAQLRMDAIQQLLSAVPADP